MPTMMVPVRGWADVLGLMLKEIVAGPEPAVEVSAIQEALAAAVQAQPEGAVMANNSDAPED